MKAFDVQSIEIQAPRRRVFAFLEEPRNLPRWASAFEQADAERARMTTPAGQVDIRLRTEADEKTGTVDWHMEFPDGGVAVAQSRVTDTTRGTSIYSFVLHAPPVPLEMLEGALVQQMQQLREELGTLKSLLEADEAHG